MRTAAKILEFSREVTVNNLTVMEAGFRHLAELKRLVHEGNAIIKSHFGPLNDHFSMQLIPAMHASERGHIARPVSSVMWEALGVITAAINHMKREPLIGPQATAPNKPPFVDATIIA